MKRRMLATALVLAAVVSAPASAMISKQNLNKAVNSAISSGSLTSVVNGDTVTLFGHVDGVYESNQAVNAAMKVADVNKVINRISTGN